MMIVFGLDDGLLVGVLLDTARNRLDFVIDVALRLVIDLRPAIDGVEDLRLPTTRCHPDGHQLFEHPSLACHAQNESETCFVSRKAWQKISDDTAVAADFGHCFIRLRLHLVLLDAEGDPVLRVAVAFSSTQSRPPCVE